MTSMCGCIEAVHADGRVSGWVRRLDTLSSLRVSARLDGLEIGHTLCSIDRSDLGGVFGFVIPSTGEFAALDLLIGRLKIVADHEDFVGELVLQPTDAVHAGLVEQTTDILLRIPEEGRQRVSDRLQRKLSESRAAKPVDTGSGTWHPLTVRGLSQIKARPDTIMLDEEVVDWMQPGAIFVLDLSEGTFSTSVNEFRSYLLGPSTTHLRGIYELGSDDCLVYGSHHFYPIITPDDNTLTFQGLDDAKFRLDHHLAHQAIGPSHHVPLIHRDGVEYRINYDAMSPSNVVKLAGETYFGSPIEPTNWGMWLIQGLQSAWRFRESGQRGHLLAFASLAFQRKLLSFIGIQEDKIVDMAQWRVYRCERLISVHYSHDTSLTVRPSDREVIDFIIRRSREMTGGLRRRRAVFVSRSNITQSKGGQYRALINEQALIAEMERIGLDIVQPEMLPFEEQVRLFNDADLVVGLGGAGLFNTVFCRAGITVVTIESSTFFVNNHANLFASLGLRYGVIFGKRDVEDPSTVHYRWTVDVASVSARIVSLL